MVGQTAQDRINCGIKFIIYNTMFLYSKEEWITMINIELQENELTHDKEQDATTFNRRSN